MLEPWLSPSCHPAILLYLHHKKDTWLALCAIYPPSLSSLANHRHTRDLHMLKEPSVVFGVYCLVNRDSLMDYDNPNWLVPPIIINHSLGDSLQAIIFQSSGRLKRLGLPTHEPRDILLILLTIIKFHPDALGPWCDRGILHTKYGTPMINSPVAVKICGCTFVVRKTCFFSTKTGSKCRCSLQLPGS